MGLPRYLSDRLDKSLEASTFASLIIAGYNAGVVAANTKEKNIVDTVYRAATEKHLSPGKIACDILAWHWRASMRKKDCSADGLERRKAQLYVGLEHTGFHPKAEFREVEVPRYFLSRLEEENKKGEARDKRAIELREEIKKYRARVYASRNFPAKLKAIIFERDNYTCRGCLRGRAALAEAGLHLECDHVVAWDDGGQTSYDNGQTLCSECNKAKHHAKSYLNAVSRLRSVS